MKKQYTVKSVAKLTPYQIDRLTDIEVIAAYTDIRVAVAKRLAALERSGYIEKHPKFEAPETASITKIAADIGMSKPIRKVGEKGLIGEAIEDPLKAEELVVKTDLREKLLDIAQYLKTGPSVTKERLGYEARRNNIGEAYDLSDSQFKKMDAFFEAVRNYSKEQGFRVGSDEILEFWQDMIKMKKITRAASSEKTIQEAYEVWTKNSAKFAKALSSYQEDINEIKRLRGLKKAGVISEEEKQDLKTLQEKHNKDVAMKKELSEALETVLPKKRKQKMTVKRAIKQVKKKVKQVKKQMNKKKR